MQLLCPFKAPIQRQSSAAEVDQRISQNPFPEQKLEKSEDDRTPVPDKSVRPCSRPRGIRPRGDAEPDDPAHGHRRRLADTVQHLTAGILPRAGNGGGAGKRPPGPDAGDRRVTEIRRSRSTDHRGCGYPSYCQARSSRPGPLDRRMGYQRIQSREP